jgi:hypothetical protein
MPPNSSNSKYNAPGTLSDRYRRGNRRWSPVVKSKESPEKIKEDSTELYWTIVVTVTGGCGGNVITYACNCPDKTKEIAAAPGYKANPASGEEFFPRIFAVELQKSYRSIYQRYIRARKILAQVQYVGVTNGNRFVYRIPTQISAEVARSWTASQAGSPADCKHIIAVKIYRGELESVPLDAPENPLDL